MIPHQYSKENRELAKFYDRIGSYLDEPEFQPTDSSVKSTKSQLKEEEKYGKITDSEFENILHAYDFQQNSSDLKDKHVISNSVAGKNFAQLLFSKPGFHHPGSTSHLINKLQLEDAHLTSFLGGLSTYKLQENEDISGLKRERTSLAASQASKKANECLDKKDLKLAYSYIEKAFKLNPNNGNAFAARARWYSANCKQREAIKDYKESLENNPDDKISIKKNLSHALFNQGLAMYLKEEYKNALDLFEEALEYDQGSEEARYHASLCASSLRARNSFGFQQLAYRK